jgi:hypothetical protein
VIVNKVHAEGEVVAARAEIEAGLGALFDADLAVRIADNLADFQVLAESDRRNIERLATELGTGAVIEVPYLDHDVHDLAGLVEVNRYLFASGAEEREAISAAV